MLANAQARSSRNLAEFCQIDRSSRPIDFTDLAKRVAAIRERRARESAEINAALADTLPASAAANDDFDLDSLDDLLPAVIELRHAPAVIDLDGNPLEDAAEAPAPLARNPKKVGSKPRVSYARDRRNLSWIKGYVPDVRPAMKGSPTSASVAGTITPSSTSIPTPPSPASTSTRKRQSANDNDRRAPPAWSRTTEIIRGHCYARTVSTTGAGLSWSLNLGGKVLKAANDNPKGLKTRLQDRLKKALAASPLGARDFLFAIEATPSGRWHLHGIVDAATDERSAVEDVLRRVGGAWDSKHHQEAQAHTDVLWGPDGWVRYISKDAPRTRRLLGVKSVLSVTRGCRARAEALWQATRRAAVP